MVALSEIRSANSALRTKQPNLALTAVFVGATAGIGLATLQAFTKHIPHPTAIIVGRSRARFEPHLRALQALNPAASLTFLEHEVELLRDVDAAARAIAKTLDGQKIDLLCLSQGYVSFAGRQPNADGLDTSISLRYHGRVRFVHDLLPSLAPRARVVSVLAGTQEGPVFEEDLGLESHYSLTNSMNHFGTLMTMSFDHLAAQPENSDRVFVHAFPGVVSTGLLGKSATGVLGVLFRWVLEPVMGLFVSGAADVGERMLWYGTAEGFGEAEAKKGVCVPVNEKGEVKEIEVLKGYREKGFAAKVGEWEQGVFEKVA